MVMLISHDCPCCRKWVQTSDLWHCEDCWNRFHNGVRDGDFLTREEWDAKHPDNPALICEKRIVDIKRGIHDK